MERLYGIAKTISETDNGWNDPGLSINKVAEHTEFVTVVELRASETKPTKLKCKRLQYGTVHFGAKRNEKKWLQRQTQKAQRKLLNQNQW